MTTAILIGFRHQGGVIGTLPGALIDIHRAYRFCHSLNWNTHVISDITDEKLPSGISSVIAHGSIHNAIMTFMTEIKSDKLINIRTAIELKNALNTILSKNQNKRLFIYYSGHGLYSSIVCPDSNKLDFMDFRSLITDSTKRLGDADGPEVFLVLDCCKPGNLFLPYTLKDEKFDISSTYIASKNRILLITSADTDQYSTATKFGSLFSEFFFDYLNKLLNKDAGKWPSRNLNVIRKAINDNLQKSKTGYKQTMNVYSSHVMLPLLWSWIGAMNYDIKIDFDCKTITMRKL